MPRLIHPVLAVLLGLSMTGLRHGAVRAAGEGGDAQATAGDAWPEGKYLSVEQVHQRWQAQDPEMQLLNVVDEVFYDLGHIPGSVKITWNTLPGRLGELEAGRHIVIYCRRGVRSEAAFRTLRSAGFAHVWVMQGGLEAWRGRGYPTTPP
jgi:rhodanese-related sulfurtransferase